MAGLRQNHLRHAKTVTKTSRPRLAKQLRVVVAVALFGTGLAAVVSSWDGLFPIPASRLVKVYRTHGCRCAFNWVEALKAEGFVVRLYEYETLEYVRASLHMPHDLRGCHVGVYLGYFVEGHVSPAALTSLSLQRPRGLGLATENSALADAEHLSVSSDAQSLVLLIEHDGHARSWFQPQTNNSELQND